jgi:spoIIIJ-associated protein
MEWVETTAKTVDAAREAALDQLGVAGDEAEFDVLEEPRPGLFGRVRGQARVRARVMPTPVRPKQERRRKGRDKPKSAATKSSSSSGESAGADATDTQESADNSGRSKAPATQASAKRSSSGDSPQSRGRNNGRTKSNEQNQEQSMSNEHDRPESTVTPEEVGAAAVAFMNGLTDAFGADATTDLEADGIELAVKVTGSDLGLLVGPGGRTLTAVQDLARVAAQRRLGDHETRLRVDVAGYRERRNAALALFAQEVAESVRSTGSARSLEPMTSADRKVIHDVLNDEDGVDSRSEGEDPNRRIVIVPA